jgi:hypothetical protein
VPSRLRPRGVVAMLDHSRLVLAARCRERKKSMSDAE